MKFTERKQFLYDPELYGRRADVQMALSIHAEYVKLHSPNQPLPKALEVDRRSEKYDALWHVPLDDRTVFSREMDIYAIVQQEKPDWRLTRVGIVPQQKSNFWMSNLHLAAIDWFPMNGDMIYHNGYRNIIIKVIVDPKGIWQQTNVWLGLIVTTIIPAEGDARPVLDPGTLVPREKIQTRLAPEV